MVQLVADGLDVTLGPRSRPTFPDLEHQSFPSLTNISPIHITENSEISRQRRLISHQQPSMNMPTPTQPRTRRQAAPADAAHRLNATTAAVIEVLAAPGSGKTHELLNRAETLLQTGVPARQLVLLSFSNAAIGELERRARERDGARGHALPGGQLASVSMLTVHALALRVAGGGTVLSDKEEAGYLLRAISRLLKIAKKGKVWADRSKPLRQRRVKQLRELRERPMLRAVLGLFGFVSAANCKLDDAFERDRFGDLLDYQDILLHLRPVWGSLKREDGAVDFGDLVRRARKRVEKGKVRFDFKHILVDEFQDSSPAQVQLLASLVALPGRSLVVFGDPGQAIYGFAGAAYTPLSSVVDGVRIVRLPVSRRLTPQVAALASAVAGLKGDAAIRTEKPDGAMPLLVSSKHEVEQAKRIAGDIRALINQGVPASQIAVLGRIKALLGPVERELLAVGVLANPMHGVRKRLHVLRVLRLVRVIERAQQRGEKVRVKAVKGALSKVAGVADKRWSAAVTKLRVAAKFSSFAGRYTTAAQAYVTLVFGARTEECVQVLHGLNAWGALARGYADADAMKVAAKGMSKDAVVLGTIHAAKGREWDHVFVVGATDGVLPWYQSTDALSLVEERNLLYVAITRARDAVRIYHAPLVHARSRQIFDSASRFLAPKRVQALMRAEGVLK